MDLLSLLHCSFSYSYQPCIRCCCLTLSRSTESLLMFSGGADGLVVRLGGQVKCRTHIGCVSTAVTVLFPLLSVRRVCSADSRPCAPTVQPYSSATSLAVRALLSFREPSAPARESSDHALTAPVAHVTRMRGDEKRAVLQSQQQLQCISIMHPAEPVAT